MLRKQIGRLTAVLTPLIFIITACTTAAPPVQETAVTAPPELPVQSGLEPTDVVPIVPLIPTVETVEEIVLPDLGQAPEITNEVWVNADAPVTLASQQGKVVLVEFWTFG
ncbi:MAG: hypothetical protein DWQ04_29295 [Chloroflexi bacterium]|nr:MAG: hypothetical protein DWQ04_29295 [Chloroflexota bacterium]